ncbi:MAG: FecR domain-containing protein [Polaromonas sp.]|nr:FecR domain-containing protein [Polaromonas sp.]
MNTATTVPLITIASAARRMLRVAHPAVVCRRCVTVLLALAAGPILAQLPPVASGAAASASTEAPTAHAGVLKQLRGDVRLASPGGPTRPASSGDRLAPADRIVTGPGAGVSAVLRDGTTLVVGPSTQLDFKDFRFDSTTQEGSLLVALIEGSMRMMSGLVGKLHPETVRIETKTALIGVRGTDFIVEADAQP